ncbi:Glycosyltransferase [Butyrivibrio fibrisolvens 16/4]|nr:Glycosyltransferase [Butyrivibrio fibrisolvens 16/4]
MKKIVFWQQRHGIYYANLCNLFHVNNAPKAYILTFIYKKDEGVKGVLKSFLYKGAVKSKAITNIICYSKHEVEYYGNLFNAREGKIVSTTFGLADQKYRNGESIITNEGFLFDVGKSNRDHKFLEEALENSQYKAIIADRTYESTGSSNCIVRRDVKYGDDLYSMIEKCFAVIVPLVDENISAGQTVFIQAMMFSKPIIVTTSNTIDEYVINGENGFIISKTKDSLLNCLNKLTDDSELYASMCVKSRKMFEDSYSFKALGMNVGDIIIKSLK